MISSGEEGRPGCRFASLVDVNISGVTSLKPIKWYKDLAESKDRLEAGAFLVEGERAVAQVAGSRPREIMEIITTGPLPDRYERFPQRLVTGRQMDSISSTRTPQGIIAVVGLPTDTYSSRLPEDIGSKVLLLEHVQDPGNVGTLIRSAVAFGFSGVILTDKCADPFSPKCVQSTAGAVLSLWIRRTPGYLDLVESLKSNNYVLVAADLSGDEDLSVLHGQGKLLLALGNEAAGLSAQILGRADHRVRIPIIRENAESLNVAACGAICMFLSGR
jgi:RNA methyltransferase, TrmH family